MNPLKRITDLRKQRSKPLVVQREEKMRRNVLQLRKVSARKALEFDFRKKSSDREKTNTYYFARESRIKPQGSKLKIALAFFGFVLLLNFIGVWGSGKSTLEKNIGQAFAGIEELSEASKSFLEGDFENSQNRFYKAIVILDQVEDELLTLSGAGVVLSTQPEGVQAGSRLVSSGKAIATAGEKFAEAGNEVRNALASWKIRNEGVQQGKFVESFTEQLKSPIAKILEGYTKLENANALLKLVEIDALPNELKGKVSLAQSQLDFLIQETQPFIKSLPGLPKLLGDDFPRKYLILFQNPDEIRPTGGFIGNIATLTLNDGFVSKFEIKNVYEIDGQLVGKFTPPEGFGFITNNWGLRDSNYHPDFPTSAESASFLFEEAGFGSVDGVVGVNANFLTRIVEVLDGVKLPRFDKKIEAKDLNLLLSLVIETKVDGKENPKIILNELWEELKKQLPNIPPSTLVNLAMQGIEAKEILFYSPNDAINSIAQNLGMENSLQKTDGDYLFVVNTSLSGNKSDRYASNEISHVSEIDEEGSVVDTLTILRKHAWNDSGEKRIVNLAKDFGIPLEEDLKEIMGRGRNVDLIKVFLPLGSELIEVDGIPRERVEVEESLGKTYFMFSLTTQPKFSREVMLRYKLPKNVKNSYSFLGEFQGGDKTHQIKKVVGKDGKEIFEGEINLGNEKIWKF